MAGANEEFAAEVERFAKAVQKHIPDTPLTEWLSACMPHAVSALNLGSVTKQETTWCKDEPIEWEDKDEPTEPEDSAAEAVPPLGAEAVPPPVPPFASLTRDEQIAQRQLSPKLHAWQIPELRAFVDGLEDFLASTNMTEDVSQLAGKCAMVAVLFRGVRGLFGIEERAAVDSKWTVVVVGE